MTTDVLVSAKTATWARQEKSSAGFHLRAHLELDIPHPAWAAHARAWRTHVEDSRRQMRIE
jgi:hypothetical protein